MTRGEKNKSAFLATSVNVFDPFKRYELHSVDFQGNQAKAYVIQHWVGYINKEDGKYVRPMRKRVALGLVKKKNGESMTGKKVSPNFR